MMPDALLEVLSCRDCLSDPCEIVEDCIPVPFFGRLEQARVVTLAINPSAGEFFGDKVLSQLRTRFPVCLEDFDSRDWGAKPRGERLPMLRDFACDSRKDL